MSEERTSFSERDAIELLLPWYVGGTLDATDRRRVERYLAQHPEIRHQLDLIREERDQLAAHAPPSGQLNRLIARLPRRRFDLLARRANAGTRAIADFFATPTARAVRLAAVAAGALVLIEAATITALILRDHVGDHRTAAGYGADAGVSFWIGFTDAASAAAISRLMTELNAHIVDGPKPGGIYKVEVHSTDRSPVAVARLSQRLAARQDLVRTLLPAKE